MALRKILTFEGKSVVATEFGNIDNGTQRASFLTYIKVSNISGNKNQVLATVNFNSESLQFNKQYKVDVSSEPNSANFIVQIYEYLKTLPEFSGAENC